MNKHPYEIYLQYHEIEHTKTRARRPQSNGICEAFHKTVLNEFCKVAFRKKIYSSLEELQKNLDEWLEDYNNKRTHQGKRCQGRTPMETFMDGMTALTSKDLEKHFSEGMATCKI